MALLIGRIKMQEIMRGARGRKKFTFIITRSYGAKTITAKKMFMPFLLDIF